MRPNGSSNTFPTQAGSGGSTLKYLSIVNDRPPSVLLMPQRPGDQPGSRLQAPPGNSSPHALDCSPRLPFYCNFQALCSPAALWHITFYVEGLFILNWWSFFLLSLSAPRRKSEKGSLIADSVLILKYYMLYALVHANRPMFDWSESHSSIKSYAIIRMRENKTLKCRRHLLLLPYLKNT